MTVKSGFGVNCQPRVLNTTPIVRWANALENYMRNVALVSMAILTSIAVLAFRAAAQEEKPIALMPTWALHIPDKGQPPATEEPKGPIHVPGSSKTYTAA